MPASTKSFADLDELRSAAVELDGAWAKRLVVVAGCCQLFVHVRSRAAPPKRSRSDVGGRDYLRRRLITEVLGPCPREDPHVESDEVGRRAVLVPRVAVTEFRADLHRWATGNPDLEISVTGPWPVTRH